MKLKVEIEILKIDELSDQARDKAVCDHYNFFASVQEPFEGEYEDITEDDVLDNIIANDYFFYSSGELADVTTYVGMHPRAGNTILKHDGKEYNITKLMQTHA